MRAAVLKSGKQVPALGQGTWHLGEGEHDRSQEVAALRKGIQLGRPSSWAVLLAVAKKRSLFVSPRIANCA
jgi:hypothetical protein